MTSALVDALPEDAIMLHAHANDWKHAVTIAGDALVASGSTSHAYTDAMIDAITELGPYIVIAPGLALAHARPSEAVLRTGLSWISLTEPIEFGHTTNDPVSLVIGLAAPDEDGHISIMSSLAAVLADTDAMARLSDTENPSQVRGLLAELTAD